MPTRPLTRRGRGTVLRGLRAWYDAEMSTKEQEGEAPKYVVGGKGFELWEGHWMYALKGGNNGDKLRGKFFFYNPQNGSMKAHPNYSWNGASIPKNVQWLVRKDRKTQISSLPHDLHYQMGRLGVFADVPGARKAIDKMFYDSMRRAGIGWLKARTMYLAVRVGGASSFKAK